MHRPMEVSRSTCAPSAGAVLVKRGAEVIRTGHAERSDGRREPTSALPQPGRYRREFHRLIRRPDPSLRTNGLVAQAGEPELGLSHKEFTRPRTDGAATRRPVALLPTDPLPLA